MAEKLLKSSSVNDLQFTAKMVFDLFLISSATLSIDRPL